MFFIPDIDCDSAIDYFKIVYVHWKEMKETEKRKNLVLRIKSLVTTRNSKGI